MAENSNTQRTIAALIALTRRDEIEWVQSLRLDYFTAKVDGGHIKLTQYTSEAVGIYEARFGYRLQATIDTQLVLDFQGADQLWTAIEESGKSSRFEPWLQKIETRVAHGEDAG